LELDLESSFTSFLGACCGLAFGGTAFCSFFFFRAACSDNIFIFD
jgi:hypothetical protein